MGNKQTIISPNKNKLKGNDKGKEKELGLPLSYQINLDLSLQNQIFLVGLFSSFNFRFVFNLEKEQLFFLINLAVVSDFYIFLSCPNFL